MLSRSLGVDSGVALFVTSNAATFSNLQESVTGKQRQSLGKGRDRRQRGAESPIERQKESWESENGNRE